MIKTIRQIADALRIKYRIGTQEHPASTLARALIHPSTNEVVAEVDANGTLTGTAVTALVATVSGMPVGSVTAYAGATAPSGWALCYGQSLVRATYPALFTAIGTVYGSADGTHFNLPDLRGRVVAGQDDMGGVSANRLTAAADQGMDGDVLGQAGGAENITLGVSVTDAGSDGFAYGFSLINCVQPTLILNYIIKLT